MSDTERLIAEVKAALAEWDELPDDGLHLAQVWLTALVAALEQAEAENAKLRAAMHNEFASLVAALRGEERP